MTWLKLNINYIGASKKSQIFRSKKFQEGQYTFNYPVYDKKMNKIGRIKDIFGPVVMPYISVQLDAEINKEDFDFYSDALYTKMKKSKK